MILIKHVSTREERLDPEELIVCNQFIWWVNLQYAVLNKAKSTHQSFICSKHDRRCFEKFPEFSYVFFDSLLKTPWTVIGSQKYLVILTLLSHLALVCTKTRVHYRSQNRNKSRIFGTTDVSRRSKPTSCLRGGRKNMHRSNEKIQLLM